MNKEQIQKYIDEHRRFFGHCTILEDEEGFYVDVDGSVDLHHLSIKELPNNMLPFRFGTVTGRFNISSNTLLKSLKGCPKKVGDDFDCSFNDSITSLEGGPEEVGRDYMINVCENLKSFVGLPKIMHNGYIDVTDNNDSAKDYLTILKTKGVSKVYCDNLDVREIINRHLKGRDIMTAQEELIDAGLEQYARFSSPKVKVAEAFNDDVKPWMLELEKAQHTLDSFGIENHSVIWDNKRNMPVANVNGDVDFSQTSFETIPVKFGHVTGNFILTNSSRLTSLKNAPDTLDGDLNLMNCVVLSTLEGCPKKVNSCYLSRTGVSNLVGGPEEVENDFYFSDCRALITLEGAPRTVGGFFSGTDCIWLKSLKGSPETIGKSYSIAGAESLKTTEGITPHIGRHLILKGCDDLQKLVGVKSMNGLIDLTSCDKITNILAIFKIKGIKRFDYHDEQVQNIIMKYYSSSDIMSAQEELIDAGFARMANLK